jgi:hypothetical protein
MKVRKMGILILSRHRSAESEKNTLRTGFNHGLQHVRFLPRRFFVLIRSEFSFFQVFLHNLRAPKF